MAGPGVRGALVGVLMVARERLVDAVTDALLATELDVVMWDRELVGRLAVAAIEAYRRVAREELAAQEAGWREEFLALLRRVGMNEV